MKRKFIHDITRNVDAATASSQVRHNVPWRQMTQAAAFQHALDGKSTAVKMVHGRYGPLPQLKQSNSVALTGWDYDNTPNSAVSSQLFTLSTGDEWYHRMGMRVCLVGYHVPVTLVFSTPNLASLDWDRVFVETFLVVDAAGDGSVPTVNDLFPDTVEGPLPNLPGTHRFKVIERKMVEFDAKQEYKVDVTGTLTAGDGEIISTTTEYNKSLESVRRFDFTGVFDEPLLVDFPGNVPSVNFHLISRLKYPAVGLSSTVLQTFNMFSIEPVFYFLDSP